MTTSKLVIAQADNGKFVAASTDVPYFCTIGDSAEAVRARAIEAAKFYEEAVAHRAPAAPVAPRIRPPIVQVVPYKTEAWLPKVAMGAV